MINCNSAPLNRRVHDVLNMAGKMSYEVSEREYEAIAVLRDVIILVADEMKNSLGHASPGLESMRVCALNEIMRAEKSLFCE